MMSTNVIPHLYVQYEYNGILSLPYLPETMKGLFIVLNPVLPGGETLSKLHVGKQHLQPCKYHMWAISVSDITCLGMNRREAHSQAKITARGCMQHHKERSRERGEGVGGEGEGAGARG